MVGWLEDSGFSSPPRLKSRCSHLSCVNFSIFRRCTFSGRRRSTRLRGTYGDFVKSQDHMLAHSLEGAHRGRVCVCALIAVSACVCTVLKNTCRDYTVTGSPVQLRILLMTQSIDQSNVPRGATSVAPSGRVTVGPTCQPVYERKKW